MKVCQFSFRAVYSWQTFLRCNYMNSKELQVETGHFTRIVNPLIEQLIKIPFKGCELAMVIFIIRKTYGYQKAQDAISLTQFEEGTGRSRQTIVTALKNLQLVNVVRLVKKGTSKKQSNIWAINKYYDTWKLVNMARLVKRRHSTSLTEPLQLVYPPRHTKERQKKYTKERGEQSSQEIVQVIDMFKEINPAFNTWYSNKTERASVQWLLETYGMEDITKKIAFLSVLNKTPYAPQTVTPYQLKNNIAKIINFISQNKASTKNWQNNVIW